LRISGYGTDGYLTVSQIQGREEQPRYIGTGVCSVISSKAANL